MSLRLGKRVFWGRRHIGRQHIMQIPQTSHLTFLIVLVLVSIRGVVDFSVAILYVIQDSKGTRLRYTCPWLLPWLTQVLTVESTGTITALRIPVASTVKSLCHQIWTAPFYNDSLTLLPVSSPDLVIRARKVNSLLYTLVNRLSLFLSKISGLLLSCVGRVSVTSENCVVSYLPVYIGAVDPQRRVE